MKKLFLLAVWVFLFNATAISQNEPTDCRSLISKIHNDLIGRIEMVKWADGSVKNNHLTSLAEWMLELKEHISRNRFGIFSRSFSNGQKCNTHIIDIFKNLFQSNNRYIFQAGRFAGLDDCTGNYNPALNTAQTFGRLKQIAFVLQSTLQSPGATTLRTTEKDSYTAFYEYLYDEKNQNDVGIPAFFYSHLDDMKKATGFDPDPKGQDKKIFAQSFILTFKPELKFYFGNAEEEYVRADAGNTISQIRNGPEFEGVHRRDAYDEFFAGLNLIANDLANLLDLCTDYSKGLLSKVTLSPAQYEAAPLPKKPEGEEGRLKPGHGWVLLGVLTANGKIYKDYGDPPGISLHQMENEQLKHRLTVRASTYAQVPAGNYFATVSIPAYPQSRISVEAGGETNIALRLGRLELDPRNFDGTEGTQAFNVFAIVDKPGSKEGAILTNSVMCNICPRKTFDLAPGRYIVVTHYGIMQKDTVTIEKQQVTKLTITGAAKFTGPKEAITISRVVVNKPEFVASLVNGQEIQLPPGLYEIRRPDNLYTYRQKMEPGGSYIFVRP